MIRFSVTYVTGNLPATEVLTPLQFRYGRFNVFVRAEWMDSRAYSIRIVNAC
jgi:hypothetical protein